ncbi:MAG: hypothetical protein H6Q67_1721 [Firmicutes bacterium]|nr:hypothetical protein [Bacillota bacterium]
MTFKPMLAETIVDVNALAFPRIASPKLDGIRAVIIDGTVMSRNLKPIPNAHVQKLFGKEELNGLDGELILGNPCSPTVFRDTTSAVMSRDGEPAVRFNVFDDFSNPKAAFTDRIFDASLAVGEECDLVPQIEIYDLSELEALEQQWLSQGYEGAMLRLPDAPYKYGRSTVKQGHLLKLKRFKDSEAEIIGFEEQMHNCNEATRDALGQIERSHCKAGMEGRDTLGNIKVRDIKTGVEFNIGSGFNDEMRNSIWRNKDQYLSQVITYRYFPTGSKDKPRFPTFKGFRDSIDM